VITSPISQPRWTKNHRRPAIARQPPPLFGWRTKGHYNDLQEAAWRRQVLLLWGLIMKH